MLLPKIKRVAVIPDTHAPYHEPRCVKSLLKFIRDYRPHKVIQLGDLCDFNSLSRFQILSESDLVGVEAEVKAANDLLDQIEAVLPRGCEKVITLGNHDQRPELYRLNNWDAQARKLTGKAELKNAEELYKLTDRGWTSVPRGGTYQHGHALFSHGWYVNQYHAAKTLRRFFKNIYYGHTHQYQTHTINGMDGYPIQAMSIGTLSKLNLSYLGGVPSDWTQMFMYMDFWGDKFTAHPTTIIDGCFTIAGHFYQP